MNVSVVIPAYNAEETLCRAILSCSLDDNITEIIVIDDGSDNPNAVVQLINDIKLVISKPVVFISQNNQGAAAARNTGILAAKEEWVCFLDADDELMKNGVGNRINFYNNCEKNDEIAVIYSSFYRSDNQSVQIFSEECFNVDRNLIGKKGGFPGALPASIFRKSALIEIDASKIKLEIFEDFYLILKIYKNGWRVVGNSVPCYKRNYIPNSLSRTNKQLTLGQERIFLKMAFKERLLSLKEISRRFCRNLIKSLYTKLLKSY